jgi:hypothetical protein
VLVIEALPPRTEAELLSACDELAALVTEQLGASCRVEVLGSNGREQAALDA